MDIVALYPSLMKILAEDSIRRAIERYKIRCKNIDTKQLVRHLSLRYDKKMITYIGLLKVIPIPKSKMTLHTFINPRNRAKETNGDSQFSEVNRQPTRDEIVKNDRSSNCRCN